MSIVATHLDKEAVPRYHIMTYNDPFHPWIAFTHALELDFGPLPYKCPRSHLLKLTKLYMYMIITYNSQLLPIEFKVIPHNFYLTVLSVVLQWIFNVM